MSLATVALSETNEDIGASVTLVASLSKAQESAIRRLLRFRGILETASRESWGWCHTL